MAPREAPPRWGHRRRRGGELGVVLPPCAAPPRAAPPHAPPWTVVPQHAERSTAEVLRCARVRETEEKNRKEEEDDKWGPLVIERR